MFYGKKEYRWKQHNEIQVKGGNYAGGTCLEEWSLAGLYKPTGTRNEKLYTKVAGVDRSCPVGTGNRILQGRRDRAVFCSYKRCQDIPKEKVLQERVHADFK